MSGATAIRYLLANNAPMVAAVPADRILDDDPTPVNTVFPLLTVDEITSMPVGLINPNETPRAHVDRIQVTAHTKGQYGSPKGTGKAGCAALLRLALAACPNQRATLGGVNVQSITPDIAGPSLHDEVTDIWQKSRDFIVHWNE